MDRLAEYGVGEHTAVVAYDNVGGLWAARLWYLLDWIGSDVRVLDGGLRGWRETGPPVEAGDTEPTFAPVGAWRARATRAAWIDQRELAGVLGSANLVCGLAATVFDGAEPTRYSRRGHIPGSVNVPARGLFDQRGFVRTPEEIRSRHLAAGADLDRELLLYGGGGVSATANALALAHAGIRRMRVYDGSPEEWSADPALPLDVAGPIR